jgi:hypothetical protein
LCNIQNGSKKEQIKEYFVIRCISENTFEAMLGKQNLRALTVSCCLRDSIYLSWNDVEVCRLATMCNSSIAGVCVPYTIPASMSAPYSRCPHPSRLNLLLIGVPHTPNRTNVNTLVVLLGEHVTRNINAHSSTGPCTLVP